MMGELYSHRMPAFRVKVELTLQSSVKKRSVEMPRKYLSALPKATWLRSGTPSRKSAKSEPVPGTATPLITCWVAAPVKVKPPRAFDCETGLNCCMRKSPPMVTLCGRCSQVMLAETAPVWFRDTDSCPSESPPMPVVKLRAGGPQLLGDWSLPVIPALPETFPFGRLAK